MKLSVFSVQDHYPAQSRTVQQLYGEVIAQAELADALGYDTFWVAEHHFHEYGVVPNPAVMLSSLAQRTKRLRLGTAISILTFHNPLTGSRIIGVVAIVGAINVVLMTALATLAAAIYNLISDLVGGIEVTLSDP